MNFVTELVFLGNPLSAWINAALFAAGGIMAGALVSNIGALFIRALVKKDGNNPAHLRNVYRLLKRPIALLIVYEGCRLALGELVFSENWEVWETRTLRALFTVIICWSVAKLIDALIVHLTGANTAGSTRIPAGSSRIPAGSARIPAILVEMRPFLRKFFSFLMILIPFSIILRILGYNIGGILAGLGIGGAAIALASKDLLSSFFGAASVFIDKAFKPGDRIKAGGYDGFVLDMRIRTSQIKTLDNRIVTIPNSIFQTMPVENVTSEPHTRIIQVISIGAKNGFEKTREAVEILRGITLENAETPLAALGDASIAALSYIGIHVFKITFIYFIARGADYWKTINAVNMEVLRRFAEADIQFCRLENDRGA